MTYCCHIRLRYNKTWISDLMHYSDVNIKEVLPNDFLSSSEINDFSYSIVKYRLLTKCLILLTRSSSDMHRCFQTRHLDYAFTVRCCRVRQRWNVKFYIRNACVIRLDINTVHELEIYALMKTKCKRICTRSLSPTRSSTPQQFLIIIRHSLIFI